MLLLACKISAQPIACIGMADGAPLLDLAKPRPHLRPEPFVIAHPALYRFQNKRFALSPSVGRGRLSFDCESGER